HRLLLSTFTVKSTGDAGPGTLRDAITQSNADSGQPNTINFTLDAADRTITLASPLPAITSAVSIDGTSDPAAPLVALSGSSGATDGLSVQAAGTTVKGLALGNFAGTALTLKADGAVIQGNDFGTAGNGTSPAPNGTGIRVSGSSETIGGPA